jgi:predicted DCC family thiol-disulfide oxidoreductase YuxK
VSERDVPWLVFDGDCGFCTSSATWVARRLHRRDGRNAELRPWQFTDLAALGTTAERAQQEVLWVTPEGEVRGGATAFAAWLRFAGGAYAVVGRAMDLPGVRSLAAAVYRLIARNRSRLPGGTPACALPPPGYNPAQPGTETLQRGERQPADGGRGEVDVQDGHGEHVEAHPEQRG